MDRIDTMRRQTRRLLLNLITAVALAATAALIFLPATAFAQPEPEPDPGMDGGFDPGTGSRI